jgi:hypothetical protein
METTSLAILIENRMNDLQIDRKELVKRCGYVNKTKGYRHIDEWLNGMFPASMLDQLTKALELSTAEIMMAVNSDGALRIGSGSQFISMYGMEAKKYARLNMMIG